MNGNGQNTNMLAGWRGWSMLRLCVRMLSAKRAAVPAVIKPPIEEQQEKVKMADFELHAKLRKEERLPEQRLALELVKEKQVSPGTLAQIHKDLKKMLTPSIVGICHECAKYPELTRNLTALWLQLETELADRFENLTNEHIVDLADAFASVNKGSPQFFAELEIVILDSDIPLKPRQCLSLLSSYAQLNFGSPQFLSEISKRLTAAGRLDVVEGVITDSEPDISLPNLAKAAYTISRMKNNHEGGFGLYAALEKRAKMELAHNKLLLHELIHVAEYIFGGNIGSNELQALLEETLIKRFSELTLSQYVRLARALAFYLMKNPELAKCLHAYCTSHLKEFSDSQLRYLAWSFTRRPNAPAELYESLAVVLIPRLIAFRARGLVEVAEGFSRLQIPNEPLYAAAEKAVLSKMSKFTPHDLLKLQKGFAAAKQGSYSLHSMITLQLAKLIPTFRYKDCLNFVYLVRNFPGLWHHTLTSAAWAAIEDKLAAAVEFCDVEDCVKMLDVARLVNLHSLAFVKRVMSRLETCANVLSVNSFVKAYALLFEFAFPNVQSYCETVKLLATQDPQKLEGLFGAADWIHLGHILLHSNEALLVLLLKNSGAIRALTRATLDQVSSGAYGRYFALLEHMQKLVPESELQTVKAKMHEVITAFQSKKEEISEHYLALDASPKLRHLIKSSSRCAKYDVKPLYVDEGLRLIDVALLPKQSSHAQGQKHALLIRNSSHFMAHMPSSLYRSAELQKQAFTQSAGWNVVELDVAKLPDASYTAEDVNDLLRSIP